MRSANEPAIRAGVMIANVIWKHMNTDSGMVGAKAFTPPGSPPTIMILDAGPDHAPMYLLRLASGFVVKARE